MASAENDYDSSDDPDYEDSGRASDGSGTSSAVSTASESSSSSEDSDDNNNTADPSDKIPDNAPKRGGRARGGPRGGRGRGVGGPTVAKEKTQFLLGIQGLTEADIEPPVDNIGDSTVSTRDPFPNVRQHAKRPRPSVGFTVALNASEANAAFQLAFPPDVLSIYTKQRKRCPPPPLPADVTEALDAALRATTRAVDGKLRSVPHVLTATESAPAQSAPAPAVVVPDAEGVEAVDFVQQRIARAAARDAAVKAAASTTVFDQTRSDWKALREAHPELAEELDVHQKSGATHLEREEFLARAANAEWLKENRSRKKFEVAIQNKDVLF